MRSFLPLIRVEWRLLLFGFVMTFSSSLGQTYFIGLFSGEVRAALALSHGDFGALYSAATLASALALLWTGSLIDRLQLQPYTVLVCLGLALGCVSTALSQGWATLFCGLFLLRHFGQGLMSLAGPTTVVRYIDHHQGKANALTGVGYSVSEAVLPSLVIAMLALLGWREAWVAWGALLLLLVPPLGLALLHGHRARHDAYLSQLQDEARPGSSKAQRQWTRAEVVRDPLFYQFLPALLAQPLLFTGFMFHQVQLVQEKGWDLAMWGSLYMLYALVATVCKLWAGTLVDRFGAPRLVPLVCLPMGLGLLVLGVSSATAAAAGFMTLLAVSVGFYATLSSPFYAQVYGTLHLGAIKSLTSAAMVFATALAPVLMGLLIDAGVTLGTMALAAMIYTLLASALAWRAYRSHLRQLPLRV